MDVEDKELRRQKKLAKLAKQVTTAGHDDSLDDRPDGMMFDSELAPVQPELLVVSYPMSGETWLSCMFVEYVGAHYGMEPFPHVMRDGRLTGISPEQHPEFIDFLLENRTARSFCPVPAFSHQGAVGWPYLLPSLPPLPAKPSRRVLLLRDPRDVLVSHYQHVMTAGDLELDGNSGWLPGDLSISEFARSEFFGIRKIVMFMNHWVAEMQRAQGGIYFYEDFVDATEKRLRDFLVDAGVKPVSRKAVATAVSLASLSRLDAAEAKARRSRDPAAAPPAAMSVRQSRVGAYRKALSKADLNYVEEILERHLHPSLQRYVHRSESSRKAHLKGAPTGAAADRDMPSPSLAYRHIDVPLVLISQLQRSGGTLVSQLFDGHPNILAFPSELHLAKPDWPDPVKMLPDTARILGRHDRIFRQFVTSGYRKVGVIGGGDRFDFDYDVVLRNQLLERALHETEVVDNRGFFDAFFSAFFAAWRNRRPPSGEPKYVVAFAPRTNMHLARQEQPAFFSDYPDGHLITLVRKPRPWFSSARRHHAQYKVFSDAIDLWLESSRASLQLHARFPEKVTLLTLELLVTRTRAVMEFLCRRLQLPYDPVLCTPTFQGMPIKSDSNFRPVYGIDRSVLERDEFVAETEEDRDRLAAAEELYEAAAAIAQRELKSWRNLRSSG